MVVNSNTGENTIPVNQLDVDRIRNELVGNPNETFALMVARLINGVGADRRARRAARSLRGQVEAVARELVTGPVERELDVRERLCSAVENARN